MKDVVTDLFVPDETHRDVSREYFSKLDEYLAHNDVIEADKCNGRFFTHPIMADGMMDSIVGQIGFIKRQAVASIIDPFAGDGRLVKKLVAVMVAKKTLPRKTIRITLIDIDASALNDIEDIINGILVKTNVHAIVEVVRGDAFLEKRYNEYDICVTNPPWCVLKPTQGVGKHKFSAEEKLQFNKVLREYQNFLRQISPLSDTGSGFARNCVNLSRCGLEKALRMVKKGGICGVVMPATLFSDQISKPLRKVIFEEWNLISLNYYPAECKLFGKVDQTSATFVAINSKNEKHSFELGCFDKDLKRTSLICSESRIRLIQRQGYVVPFGYTDGQWNVLEKLQRLRTLESVEDLAFVRELDETRIDERLSEQGKVKFIKGFMVDRYSPEPSRCKYLADEPGRLPSSVRGPKIVWRDVSRESQLRRMKATLLPLGYIAGNSLGVIYSRSGDERMLRYALALINSYVFEFLARLYLITNHVPAGVLKQISIPDSVDAKLVERVCDEVGKKLNGQSDNADVIECLVAKCYGLSLLEFTQVLLRFEMSDDERGRILQKATAILSSDVDMNKRTRIIRRGHLLCPPNHYAAKLSELDKLIISYVPQGGNWKNIPESVPSQRLAQIRESFKAGKGSRSTYYGRLRENFPAYTISTYFSRPGNGCNIHYEQPRTLSQREAARIQSFPDYFEFKGTKGSIDDQIGNAVPPLLAYQLAMALPDKKGMFVDLFCGAGGLALGFMWAGWMPVISNDIMPGAIETHKHNIDEPAICGDITSQDVIDKIVAACTIAKAEHPDLPLYVIGGPPCQGFSTANCNRSTDDQRNWLFKAYINILKLIRPSGFIFENVTGIMNFQQGKFFQMIVKDLKTQVEDIKVMKLNAAEYGVPQRRERVIIYGSSMNNVQSFALAPKTQVVKSKELPLFPDMDDGGLPLAVSVKEAFSDLPPIADSEDGSNKPYITEPTSNYQRLMRGQITPAQFLKQIRRGTLDRN